MDPADEAFLGGLLTGKHGDVAASKPRFFMLGLKTIGAGVSANNLSSALCNRLHIMPIAPFSKSSWQRLAKQVLHNEKHAEAFVEGMATASKLPRKEMNGSHFFKCLHHHKVRTVAARCTGIEFPS